MVQYFGKRFVLPTFFVLLCGCLQVVSAQTSSADAAIENPANEFQTVSPLDKQAEQFPDHIQQAIVNELDVDFRSDEQRKKYSEFGSLTDIGEPENFAASKQLRVVKLDDAKDNADTIQNQGFHWRAAIGQSLMFLAVQHGYAFTQPKTREAIKGKFWKDYAQSVKNLHGWDDGGRFFTNYIAHPLQGSLTGFIYVQNSPQARRAQFGTSKDYWTSRMKAMLWTAAWSTQFEIGPVSQASIGNVGLKGKQTWEDIVNTPTIGTAWLIGEDAVDRFLIKAIERRNQNFYVKVFARMLLNPTRNFSNMLRFKAPWHRDRPPSR